jgi:hypothetical protein
MSTTISVKYPIIGAKVIRGKNWCYGDQDGGEGKVGTIVKSRNIGRSGVCVKWNNDTLKFWYFTGYDNRFDLYFATEEDALLQEVMEKFPSGCSYIDTDNISVVNVSKLKPAKFANVSTPGITNKTFAIYSLNSIACCATYSFEKVAPEKLGILEESIPMEDKSRVLNVIVDNIGAFIRVSPLP